jgi:hypothetical protein
MQNELDKYLDRQPQLFFCDEFSPLGHRTKKVGCKLCKSIFWGKWPKLAIFGGKAIEIPNFNTDSSMSPK